MMTINAKTERVRSTLGQTADLANLITLAGLLSGTVAIAFALNAKFSEAAVLLVVAFMCDLFDGVVAKRLKNRTGLDKIFGGELDNHVDLVTMGIAPAVILMSYGEFQF